MIQMIFCAVLIGLLQQSPTLESQQARKARKGPVFKEYGPVFKVAERTVPLKKNFKYRVIFDISQAASVKGKVNKRIESVARFMNMHALNGVKVENMEIAVILHGSATQDGLTHKAYNKRHKMDNANLDLIEKLHAKGVRFYQCGQSAYFNEVEKKELARQVDLSLSAMTALITLQAEGFQLLPW